MTGEGVVALGPEVDPAVPSVARVYDAMLGGKDNFESDRAVLQRVTQAHPFVPDIIRANRDWHGRALRWLAGTAGIDRYLDLGSGLPTAQNTHQIVQRVVPGAAVVYVDNDPAVAAFGRALLEENESTHFVVGDLTRPATVLDHPVVNAHLPFDGPLALVQCATLHFVADEDLARSIMAEYVDRLPAGSYVALSHSWRAPDAGDTGATGDAGDPQELVAYRDSVARYQEAFPTFTPRTHEQVLALLPGLELVEPGLVPLVDWWPAGPRLGPVPPAVRYALAAVGRKP